MNKTSATIKKAIIAAIVGHSFWGLSFMASRVALNTAPVILLLSHRFLIAFLLMSMLLLTPLGACRFHGKPVLPLIVLGLLEPVIYFFGEQYGILHSSTVFSGVMIALIPIASTLTAIPILGEKPTLKQLFYSVLSVGGVIGIGMLTHSSGSLDWIGVVALLVAVFSAVAYTLLNRGISGRYTPFERTYFMLTIGAVFFTVLALISLHGDLSAYVQPFEERVCHGGENRNQEGHNADPIQAAAAVCEHPDADHTADREHTAGKLTQCGLLAQDGNCSQR